MSFVSPGFFWLLMPLAALIAWRLFRANERRYDSSTVRIWRRLLQSREAPKPSFFRTTVRTLVEALIAVLLVIALAGPTTSETEGLVVLVDRTGSMKSIERRAAVAEIVRVLKQQDIDVRVVEAAADEPEGGRVPWARVLAQEGAQAPRRVVVTDFVRDPDQLPSSVGIRIVEAPFANRGLVAARGRMISPGQLEVFCAVRRTESAETGLLLPRLLVDGRALPWSGSQVTDVAGGYDVLASVNLPPNTSQLEIRLPGEDALSFDDALTLIPPMPVKDLVVASKSEGTEMPVAVGDALDALNIRFWSAVPEDRSAESWHVTVGRAPSQARGALVFGSTELATQRLPTPARATSRVPSLDLVPGLDDLEFEYVFKGPLTADHEVLIRGEVGAFVVRDKARRAVFVADHPVRRAWTERASFPFLLRALLKETDFQVVSSGADWHVPGLEDGWPEEEVRGLSTPAVERPGRQGHAQPTRAAWPAFLAASLALFLVFWKKP